MFMCVYLLYVGRMSDVFNEYLERLFKVIANPDPLAMSFQTHKIISPYELREITDINNVRTAQQRTNSMLNTVSQQLESNPQKLHTVVDVLYNHLATTDIARKIARDG